MCSTTLDDNNTDVNAAFLYSDSDEVTAPTTNVVAFHGSFNPTAATITKPISLLYHCSVHSAKLIDLLRVYGMNGYYLEKHRNRYKSVPRICYFACIAYVIFAVKTHSCDVCLLVFISSLIHNGRTIVMSIRVNFFL